MRERRIDPGVWQRSDMLAALGARDIRGVYRLLQRHGVSQRRIAAMTGQSQSEISEIIAGRRVTSYDVLVRIAEGLGVPRGRLGLAYEGQLAAVWDEPELRPVADADSGRWVVRLPVYFDSFPAAMGLCESITTASADSPPATVPSRREDEVATRRWHRDSQVLLGVRPGARGWVS